MERQRLVLHKVEEHDKNPPLPSLCCRKHVPVTVAGRIVDTFDHSSCLHHGRRRFFTQVFLGFCLFLQNSCTNSAKEFDMTVALAVRARSVLLSSCLYQAILPQVPPRFTLTFVLDAAISHSGCRCSGPRLGQQRTDPTCSHAWW